MILIPKEEAKFFVKNAHSGLYCFGKENKNIISDYEDAIGYNSCKILESVITDEEGRLHSFNDRPAVVYFWNEQFYKEWFVHGINKRENPEKSKYISKGIMYCVGSDLTNINEVRENLKIIK
jgi:hypothetical protein